MLLFDNASSMWLEGEGFLLGHVMGLGTLWKENVYAIRECCGS